MTYGYIIDREDEAEEFCDWFEGYFDLIESRTEGLSDDERPRVYFEYRRYRTKGLGDRYSHWYIMAGGRNIADDKVGLDSPQYSSVFDVDREYVVLQNPDFIFMHASTQLPATEHGYETDDTSTVAALRQELMDRPELANVNAVKNGHVYVIDEALLGVAGTLMGGCICSKSDASTAFHRPRSGSNTSGMRSPKSISRASQSVVLPIKRAYWKHVKLLEEVLSNASQLP